MALVLADRVLETCTSPGAGPVTLLGAVTGYQAFSTAIGNGNTCYYCIADQGGANWEVGIGTYSSSGNELARTTPLAGSSATPVNFSTGSQNVFVTYPAEKSVNFDIAGDISAGGGKITNVATPVAGTDAVNKDYVDNATPAVDPLLAAIIFQGTDNSSSGVPVSSIPFITTISSTSSLAANSMAFGMNTLTISGSAVYTIPTGSYLFVLNPNGFALFN